MTGGIYFFGLAFLALKILCDKFWDILCKARKSDIFFCKNSRLQYAGNKGWDVIGDDWGHEGSLEHVGSDNIRDKFCTYQQPAWIIVSCHGKKGNEFDSWSSETGKSLGNNGKKRRQVLF